MVENCANLICMTCQFEYIEDPSQMRWGPRCAGDPDALGTQMRWGPSALEQIPERCQLQPVT